MQPEMAIIVLPIPPHVLSPNSAVGTVNGRFAKASATKRQRRLADEAVQEERIETAPWGKVEVTPHFFFKTNRRRDDANAVASLKGAYDGIVDSGLVPNDSHEHWTNRPPEFNIDRLNPRVVIFIKRLA